MAPLVDVTNCVSPLDADASKRPAGGEEFLVAREEDRDAKRQQRQLQMAANARARSLERENEKLRRENLELRALSRRIGAPRVGPSPKELLTPRTPRTPRTPQRARSASPCSRTGARPTLGPPARRQNSAAGSLEVRTSGTKPWLGNGRVGRVDLRHDPAARAKMAAEQRLRAESARLALGDVAKRLTELRERLSEATLRSSQLATELEEAETAHPERMNTLICEAREALLHERESALRGIGEEASKGNELQATVRKGESELERLLVRAAALRDEQESQGGERLALLERAKAEREASCVAQASFKSRASELARTVLFARRLHNEYLSLKGNIRVFCRLRPPLPQEELEEQIKLDIGDSLQEITVYSGPQLSVTGLSEHTNSWAFEFDHIFDRRASQQTVFEEIAPLVQSALDGYRVAIFAYGQTGSGKTHTMEGGSPAGADIADSGMIPRTVDLLFSEVRELQRSGWAFDVQTNMVEVYNEVVSDLLIRQTRNDSAADTQGREEGGRRVPVADAASVHSLLRRAARERHVAATASNDRSSRSHFVFQLSIAGRGEVDGCIREVEGLLSFVDLAGSERIERSGATGERLREAQHINKSLSALGDVVEALARRGAGSGKATNQHVPYRNSKLTTLLRDSLGGDSKALMFVNISPMLSHLSETVSSLRFASKVHACNLGVAKRHSTETIASRPNGTAQTS